MDTDPTRARRSPEPPDDAPAPGDDEFRVDLERIRFSPYFSRLSTVTQVIPQAGSGTVIHNRLTHSLKVTAVARSISMTLREGLDQPNPGRAKSATARTIRELGGCDPVVVQAAASAHDLGHPPFGHLGEQALDRLARDRLGLPDGFEGNAQTFRILTTLDTCDATERGLNLTAAVRAAVLKYPWTRDAWTRSSSLPAHALPRGVGTDPANGAVKFSSYALNAAEMAEAKRAYPQIGPHQQTIECSVMDIADDIAYSVHDLDDFYRAGVLQHTPVSAEFDGWLANRASLTALTPKELGSSSHAPGYSLELAWRRAAEKDGWIADEEAFREAVLRVREGLVDGLLSTPYDGGVAADHAVAAFTRHWINRLKASVRVEPNPDVRSGHVRLAQDAWHDVVILKFVHARFVLDRPDLAIYQRGQVRVLEALVGGFSEWLDDADDAARAPRRLTDLVEATTDSYRSLLKADPDLVASWSEAAGVTHIDRGVTHIGRGGPALHGEGTAPSARVGQRRRAREADALATRLGRARSVLDYIASLTDAQALSAAGLLSGASDRLWEEGRSL